MAWRRLRRRSLLRRCSDAKSLSFFLASFVAGLTCRLDVSWIRRRAWQGAMRPSQSLLQGTRDTLIIDDYFIMATDSTNTSDMEIGEAYLSRRCIRQ